MFNTQIINDYSNHNKINCPDNIRYVFLPEVADFAEFACPERNMDASSPTIRNLSLMIQLNFLKDYENKRARGKNIVDIKININR